MLLYRFDSVDSRKSIPYSMDPYSGKIDGSDKITTLISASEPSNLKGNSYIYDMESGRFFVYNKTDLKTTVSAEAVLIPRCTMGISVYDKIGDGKKEITHINRGGRMCLTLDFNSDKNGNIWAKMYSLDDSYRNVEYDGYIIYKNQRNNFANVELTDSTLRTVLTRGEIDTEKVNQVRCGDATLYSKSRASVNYSGTTTNLSYTAPYAPSQGSNQTISTPKVFLGMPTYKRTDSESYKKDIAENAPSVVVNSSGFPRSLGRNQSSANGVGAHYEYDYSLTYQGGLDNLKSIYDDYNMSIRTITENTKTNLTKYNRFKIANPDDMLSRGFMHIFMTRPDLNFFNGNVDNLRSEVGSDPFLNYMYQKNPLLVKQLVELNGQDHQFMMMLSNKARGFQLTDDGINHDTYGKSRKGYSVAYGRRRDSELGGSMNITYRDTRDFDIINLHKIWVDYIINVFSGKWTPKMKYIQDKILDYATAIYVIVTAEDFETIIFWSKYYGVFPVSLPFSAISWDGDRSTVGAPDLQITYAYAWKEDLNPAALAELNMNSFKRGIPEHAYYAPTYNARLAAVNNTWVGPPFIELIKYTNGQLDPTNGSKIALKLRFSRN